MNNINDILKIPDRCLLNKKVTKAFFKRNFDLTSADKSLLEDAHILMTIDWVASVSPSTANINAYTDDQNSFEEVQVIAVLTGDPNFDKNKQKIAELIQKYIPYPILLIISNGEKFVVNSCNKRINQNDQTKRTVDKRFFTEDIPVNDPTSEQKQFLDSIGFSGLDKTNLKTFYDSYTQRIIALHTAKLAGIFTPRTQSRTIEDMQHLERIDTLQSEISMMEKQVRKETQMSQKVLLNTQINQKRKEIEHIKTLITTY